MSGGPRIAIDAMGGDAGPVAMIAGAARALRKDSTLQFTFYGDERQVEAQIGAHKNLEGHYEVIDSPESIGASEKPSQAIRRARTTSMGMDELKDAAALLREADYLAFSFDGFTEGDQLSRGGVDVVVTDGFSGNIALKTAEGTARFVTDLLRRAFKSSLRSKAGFALSRPALNLLKHHLDPNNHNGAVFLGLNGLVVKSHGSASPKGVANAIRVAATMVRNDITRKIGEDLDNFRAHAFANEAAQ